MSGIYIKDLDKKNNIDGTESILIQDSNGTKQLDINTLLNNNNNNVKLVKLVFFLMQQLLNILKHYFN